MSTSLSRSPLDLLLLGGWGLLLLALSAPLFLDTGASIGFWLMQCVPWLLLLPGLLKRSSRSLQWLCFLVLFFLMAGILQVFSPAPFIRALGVVTILLCAFLFPAAIVTLRRRRRAAPSGEPPHGRTS